MIIAQHDQAAADAIQRGFRTTPYQVLAGACGRSCLKTGISQAAIAEHLEEMHLSSHPTFN